MMDTPPKALLIVESDVPDPRSCQGPALLETELRRWQERYLGSFPGPKAQWTATGWLQVMGPTEEQVSVGGRQSLASVERVVNRLAILWPGQQVELHAPFDSIAACRDAFARHGLTPLAPTAGQSIGERIAWLRHQLR